MEFKDEESKKLPVYCQDFLKTRFTKYQKVAQSFEKFFDQNNLDLVIERKADIYQLQELGSQKADKDDVEATNTRISNLNDKVKHLSII